MVFQSLSLAAVLWPPLPFTPMPTERLPALGHDGNAYVVVRKTPSFQAISRRDSQYDMARYQLSTGEDLAPTGTPRTFRTADSKIVLTLIVN